MISFISAFIATLGIGLSLVTLPVSAVEEQSDPPALALGVAGLSHGHVGWILRRAKQPDIEIVGIHETDRDLAAYYCNLHGLSPDLVFDDLGEMMDVTKPEAVTAFNPIAEHIDVIREAAPRGIHVMVEKPLAFRMEDAREIQQLAMSHGIQVLTNYETTWYPSTRKTGALIRESDALGEIRKLVIRDGHQGPKEIGVGEEFLSWLTDPDMNGGGALIDFGCYGANLATWLMNNERPLAVTAVTQQIKPEVYPDVDDEATIILTYPNAQAIIQASWNWPFNRKDMTVYTTGGYIRTLDNQTMFERAVPDKTESRIVATELPEYENDPFTYLKAVVRGIHAPEPNDLSSLENNLIVVEILDAARTSARTGRTVVLD